MAMNVKTSRVLLKKTRLEGAVSALIMESMEAILIRILLTTENKIIELLWLFRLLINNLIKWSNPVTVDKMRIAWSCVEIVPVFAMLIM